MSIVSSLPAEFLSADAVESLDSSDTIRAALPILTVDRLDTKPATFSGQQVAAVYIHIGTAKHLVAYSQSDGEWRVVETVDEMALETTPETFKETAEGLREWVTDRLEESEGIQLGGFETSHPGHPFAD